MAEAIAKLRYCTRPAPSEPTVTIFEDGKPDNRALKIINLLLPRGESLLALAEVGCEYRLFSRISVTSYEFFGVTSRNFFLTARDKLNKQGEIEVDCPLSDIRCVRFHRSDDGSKNGPILEIITGDKNFRVTFRPWAGEGETLENVRRLGDMLATVMSLPKDKRCAAPLMLKAGFRAAEPSVERPGG